MLLLHQQNLQKLLADDFHGKASNSYHAMASSRSRATTGELSSTVKHALELARYTQLLHIALNSAALSLSPISRT